MRAAALASAALLLLGGASSGLETKPSNAPGIAISIIIDDLGNNLPQDRRAIRLPGPVACAILPHTPHAARLAREAHTSGKEVILHLPMESEDDADPGPGSLAANMHAADISATLDQDLRTVPHAVGVSSHMGSYLTKQPQPMRWLMHALAQRGGLYYVDSRTTPDTVAAAIATELGVPNLERNVFLDDDRRRSAIERQFERLLELAGRQGTALGIGHPYPETLAFLESRLVELNNAHVRLVPPSQLLARMRAAIGDERLR
jgi:polysaccharide deacetylase 2 family uncharacterized protein YibQ